MKKAILFKKLENHQIQCTACSWYCKINPDKTGICGVRKNIDGELYLLVYGKASAVNIDPIEKKPLFHFLPGSEILSIGTIGCNFACDFCQNWDISQVTKGKGVSIFGQDLSPEDAVSYCLKNNIPGVAFTYNEPAIFFEYAYDTMILAKKEGIKTVYVSNGYESKEQIKMLKGYLDGINIDLKAFTEKFYQRVCSAKLAPVLENIEGFFEAGVWTEITTLVIPDENDSDKELTDIAKFLASISKDIPWHVTRFHPDYKMQDKKETPEETLKRAYEIGKKEGLKFVYVGNVLDENHESTYCPKCNLPLIKRCWHDIEMVNFKNGKCRKCGEKIPGIFK